MEASVGPRFSFGQNWQSFLSILDGERIAEAERSLKEMLGVESLRDRIFLDIGSGSGLFSLAAMRLGATCVHSLDNDPQSVACTRELKRRWFPDADNWVIERGDVLDKRYLEQLGEWDVVYSWGVLHHTGNMQVALENVTSLVSEKGLLFIAIYNDQGLLSSYWKGVKRLYNRVPRPLQKLMEYGFFIFFAFAMFVSDILRQRSPLTRYTGQGRRGMAIYRDVVDWIGGYPFDVAAPESIFRFYRDRKFTLKELKTCGGKHGCNEFVFCKCVLNRTT